MADEFKIELVGVKQALAMFDPNKVRLAANAALNRVSGKAKTETGRMIRQDYNIKAQRLNQYLRLSVKAAGNVIQAVISGRGKGLALAYFDARQAGKFIVSVGRGKDRKRYLGQRYGRGYAGNVSVLVKRGGGRKTVTGDYGNRPFLQRMRSGHIGVWIRTGKGRKPIEQLLGPGVGGLFGSRRIMDATKQIINSRWKPEFNHQLDYYLKRPT